MGMNDTPSGERCHIGFFGRRNAGKSSVVNAITGQDLAIVSATKGTTTDPVRKAMELLPLGPVVIIDTPGFDDEGALGEQRVARARRELNRCDLAVLVVDANEGMTAADREMEALFKEKSLPYLILMNKSDLLGEVPEAGEHVRYVSAKEGTGIYEAKEAIATLYAGHENAKRVVGDLLKPLDIVVLVIPIDKAAPKGRLILPQQQVIRDALEAGACPLTVRETELAALLEKLGQDPALVITDSQVFGQVARIVPARVPLTSFSILMARYKGFLDEALRGVSVIPTLKGGERILIAEGCTHHRQCGDIGTEKLPKWIREYTGKDFIFETSSGQGFPADLSPYALVLHCGGCVLNEKEMRWRMMSAVDQGVPFTNYGTTIAFLKGILKRSIEICRPADITL